MKVFTQPQLVLAWVLFYLIERNEVNASCITISSNCVAARDFELLERNVHVATARLRHDINATSLYNQVLLLRNKFARKRRRIQQAILVKIDEQRKFLHNVSLRIETWSDQVNKYEIILREFEMQRLDNSQKISSVYQRLSSVKSECSTPRKVETASSCVRAERGRDCAEIYRNGGTRNGIYFIRPRKKTFPVFCNQEKDGGGWTYLQRHINNDVDFNRNWVAFKYGFGNLSCEEDTNFWIGNEAMHELTQNSDQMLKVEVGDWSENYGYALYNTFGVGPEESNYTLNIGGYVEAEDISEVIGDAFSGFNFGDPIDEIFTNHVGAQFTTYDRDNDNYIGNCAEQGAGAWWYNRCSAVNLNGVVYNQGFYSSTDTIDGYDNGMIWGPWTGLWYSLRWSRMMIRPKRFV